MTRRVTRLGCPPHRPAGLALLIFAAATFTGCNGPFILMSGGALEGRVEATPESWDFPEATGVAQLETRPNDPYSVNLAYTQIEGALYLNAGDTETEWVKHIAQDSRVRLRKEGVLYPARAVRVHDTKEIARFAKAWKAASMFRRDPTRLERVWIYRLEARNASD